MNRASGFTLVEVVVASTILVVILGAAFTTISTGQKASKQTLSMIDVDDNLRVILHSLAEELRWAGRVGEDTNENDLLDTGEDANGNGRLEDDWVVTASSITFNVRRTSGYALPITYRLVGDRLQKTVMLNPAGKTTTITLVKGVTSFQLAENGNGVDVNLTVTVVAEDGTTVNREQAIKVTLRN